MERTLLALLAACSGLPSSIDPRVRAVVLVLVILVFVARWLFPKGVSVHVVLISIVTGATP